MKQRLSTYAIQQWLFAEAAPYIQCDLGESGIHPRMVSDFAWADLGDLNYSSDNGNVELRAEIAQLYGVRPEQVIVTHGGQEALFLCYAATLGPGDHVITFSPGWQQAWEVPRFLGAEVTRLRLIGEDHYRIDWSRPRMARQANTRLISLNFPHNPTGTDFGPDDIQQLGDSTDDRVLVVNDEEYRLDFYNSVIHRVPKSVAVGSLSKVWGFPGLRVGWAVGDRETIEHMVNIKRYTTVSNSPLCEKLAIQILRRRKEFLDSYRLMTSAGLAFLHDWARSHEFEIVTPAGTPFAYMLLKPSIGAMSLARFVLSMYGVLVMPAEVFDDTGAIRLSFGRPLPILAEGLEKLALGIRRFNS